MKLIGYFFSAVSVVSSNGYVGPLPRIKMPFFLLSTCIEELRSTPKIFIFLPNPQLASEKIPFVFQIQYHIQNIRTDQYQKFLLI